MSILPIFVFNTMNDQQILFLQTLAKHHIAVYYYIRPDKIRCMLSETNGFLFQKYGRRGRKTQVFKWQNGETTWIATWHVPFYRIMQQIEIW